MSTSDQPVVAPLRRASSALAEQVLRERRGTLPEAPALALADLLDLIESEAIAQRIPRPVFDAAVKVAVGIITSPDGADDWQPDQKADSDPAADPNTVHTDLGAPVTEYEVLDRLFEALPDTVEADLYPVRDDLPRAEFYPKVRGECWRILAEHHPHPHKQPDQDRPVQDRPALTRPVTAFDRPAGNVYAVADDGGTPLDDLSQRPTIIAPVEITEQEHPDA